MTYKELKQQKKTILQHIQANEISDALGDLQMMIRQCVNKDFLIQLDYHRQTYMNILKYSFELGDDPEKETVYNRLVKALLELTDEAEEDIIVNNNLRQYGGKKQKINSQSDSIRESFVTSSKENATVLEQELLSGSGDAPGKETMEVKERRYRDDFTRLFYHFWLKDKLEEADIKLLGSINDDLDIPWYDKSVLVSALFLSTLRHFDDKKVLALANFIDHGEKQVWHRAMVGMIIIFIHFDNRLGFYPEIMNRIEMLKDNPRFMKNLEPVIIQYLKSRETEKISKKIREEFFPEIMKIKSTLEEKLDLENLLANKEGFEDMNPDWEGMFEDSPGVFSKMEEFSKMQMDGSDVFMSAFGQFKQYPFYNELLNWFAPFYKENTTIKEEMQMMGQDFDAGKFAESLEKSHFMCNSDKYSFCFNVKHMPGMQKKMMMEMFNMELESLKELAEEEELINSDNVDRSIFTQYTQDIYRFFKLYPNRQEFVPVFDIEVQFHQLNFLKKMLSSPDLIRNTGEFYFKNKRFGLALGIFDFLTREEKSYELHEKTAYCHQQLGDIEKAIEYYHKAELIDKDRVWILKKLGFCYRKTRNYDMALKYYKQAEKLEPENLQVQASLGHVYLEMEKFEEASQHYFKVEFLDQENQRIHRPIGWCSFALGKFDTSKKYFEKVIAHEATANDYLNLAHVYWCLGSKAEAIKNYKQSLKESGNDKNWFGKTMKADGPYLTKYGIPGFDIALMEDYIKMAE